MLMLLLDEKPPRREPERIDEPARAGSVQAWAARFLTTIAQLLGDSYLHGGSWGTDLVCVSPDYFVEAVDEARRRRGTR